ncbi:hypothetical protein RugamoR64_17470 [Duganella rhizosphaerae]|uniref:DUF4124 domain-containing protein n=1 Tax=Duganella rhizosphaerae TaxID=2885763 RepID=UPI0030E8DBE3
MLSKQRGLGLIQVAIIMASLAAIAMAFLMSARHERNFFAEGLAKLTGQAPAAASAPASASASASATVAVPAAPAGVLRKCVIDGKTVLSDVDCKDGKVVKAIDTRGIEAPKVPKPEPADAAPQSATDKMIEKATR